MSVEVNWYDEEEDILHYRFSDLWLWDEYESAVQSGRTMMRGKPHYVGILNDMRAVRQPPAMLIAKAKYYIDSRPANTGMAIFVTSSLSMRSLYDILTDVYPHIGVDYLLDDDFERTVRRIKQWLADNSDTRFETG